MKGKDGILADEDSDGKQHSIFLKNIKYDWMHAAEKVANQAARSRMVLELLLFPLLNSGTVYLFLSAHVTI